MPIAEVIVHKTMGGHKWSNTHAIRWGAMSDNNAPADADLTTAGAASTFTDANTSSAPTNILQAIVAFERALHQAAVTFSDILVTDGKSNSGTTPSTVYASVSLPALVGRGGSSPAANVVAGGITMLVHRNIVGFGHKPGRLFLRGCMVDGQVMVGGTRMVQFEATAQADLTTLLATAQGSLTPYLTGGANHATVSYVLPIYVTPKQKLANPALPKVGTLVNALDVSSFSLVAPVLHQVQRGRKKKAA